MRNEVSCGLLLDGIECMAMTIGVDSSPYGFVAIPQPTGLLSLWPKGSAIDGILWQIKGVVVLDATDIESQVWLDMILDTPEHYVRGMGGSLLMIVVGLPKGKQQKGLHGVRSMNQTEESNRIIISYLSVQCERVQAVQSTTVAEVDVL